MVFRPINHWHFLKITKLYKHIYITSHIIKLVWLGKLEGRVPYGLSVNWHEYKKKRQEKKRKGKGKEERINDKKKKENEDVQRFSSS